MLTHLLTAVMLLGAPPSVPSDTAHWKIDVTHSDLSFSIRHLVGRVRGEFLSWQGTLTGDPANWSGGSATVTIDAATITTRNDRRDADLRSPNFFDVARYPTITFQSTSVTVSGDALVLVGNLTMHGVTRPITLEGEATGVSHGVGAERAGFHVTGKLNRLDYGVSWNRALEGGGVLLGDEVTIDISIEAVRLP